MTGTPFLLAFLFWSWDLFEVPVGESHSPSKKMRPPHSGKPLSWMPCARDWASCRSSGGRAGGMTSETFSHGGLQRWWEMQCTEGNPAPFLPLQRAGMHGCTQGMSFGCCTPKSGGHWALFATTVPCEEVSDGVWGSPIPQEHRVQAGWVQQGGCPLWRDRIC